jgi:hypothetical protein
MQHLSDVATDLQPRKWQGQGGADIETGVSEGDERERVVGMKGVKTDQGS